MNPLRPVAPTTIRSGVIVDITSDGRARYQLDDGAVGGPARYLRPADVTAGDPAHTHTALPPPQGTPCLVVLIDGQRSAAWVIPFPEES